MSPGTALSCTLCILVPRGPPAICQVGRHWQRKWHRLQGHESCSASIALSPSIAHIWNYQWKGFPCGSYSGLLQAPEVTRDRVYNWKQSCPCVLGWSSLSREAGPGVPLWSFPTWLILWFCEWWLMAVIKCLHCVVLFNSTGIAFV